jgi:hypothetical protein
MRLGRIEKSFGYVVDFDDEDMVEEARDALMEDMRNASRSVVSFDFESDKDNALTKDDIPDFLRRDLRFNNYYECESCGCSWDTEGMHGESDQCECGELVEPEKSEKVEE